MNHFNHKNVQLAYEAVYNQDLCESMEDLGLIDGYDCLDESRKGEVQGVEGNRLEYYRIHGRPPIDPIVSQSKSSKGALGGVIYHRGPKRLPPSQRKRDRQRLSGALAASKQELERARQRIISGASRGIRVSSKGEIMPVGESYDLYDIILEYLINEGYADTLGSAEIILENMSDEWIEDILEAREPGVKPYRPNPTQAEIRERQRKDKKKDEGSGWKDRSHIKQENPLITSHPGKPEEAKETLRRTLPDGSRIMGPGFFPSRPADRVASITSSFTRGDKPGGGDPQATRMPDKKKPRRVIPSRLDRNKG